MHYPIVLYPRSIKELTELQLSLQLENEIKLSTEQDNLTAQITNLKHKKLWPHRILLAIWLCWLLGNMFLLLTIFTSKNLLGTGLLIIAWSFLCLGTHLGIRTYFSRQQMKFQEQQKSAQRQLQSQKLKIKEIQEERIQEYQHAELKKLLAQRVEPIAFDSNARQGVSEGQFKLVCQKYFDKVVQAAEFEIPDFEHNYSADFLIFHDPTGLGIDVEIDEPYALLSKEPIHCQDTDSDNCRNDFFLSRGWVVIRFAECQVVKTPEGCCKIIAQAIAQITGDRSYLEQLENFPDLLPEKSWTTRRAKQLARKDYRFSYLPKHIKTSIKGKRRRFSKNYSNKPKTHKQTLAKAPAKDELHEDFLQLIKEHYEKIGKNKFQIMNSNWNVLIDETTSAFRVKSQDKECICMGHLKSGKYSKKISLENQKKLVLMTREYCNEHNK